MACSCGGGSAKRQFEHVAVDGRVTVLDSQTAAIEMTRRVGGTWRLKTS